MREFLSSPAAQELLELDICVAVVIVVVVIVVSIAGRVCESRVPWTL